MFFEVNDLLQLAESTARAAGDHALQHYARRTEVDRSLAHDIKLVLDRECQDVAERSILNAAPDHDVMGEEGTERRESEYTWIVDPIDGTLNFTHGLPHWGVSVGVRHREQGILAGCIYMPIYEECFIASIDTPALCNGQPVQVASPGPLNEAMVLTGVRIPEAPAEPDLSFISRIMQNSQKTRILGAAAPDMCWVACGKADAYFDMGLWDWDLAAGSIILEQAGGRAIIREYHEANRYNLIAAKPGVAEELEALLQLP